MRDYFENHALKKNQSFFSNDFNYSAFITFNEKSPEEILIILREKFKFVK